MSRLTFVLVLVVTIALVAPGAALANPAAGGAGGNTVDYEIVAPFSMSETVTDIGGGVYQYTFSFTNADTSGIWHIGVWTPFVTLTPTTTFAEKPGWLGPDPLDITTVLPEYDARNLDSSLVYYTNHWNTCSPWPQNVDLIAPGQHVTGMSFQSATYYTGPLLFGYETIDSGYAPARSDGRLRAVGSTAPVPEPGTLALLGAGMAGLTALRRRRKT